MTQCRNPQNIAPDSQDLFPVLDQESGQSVSPLVKGKGSPQGQGLGPAGSPRLCVVMPVVINNDNKYHTL